MNQVSHVIFPAIANEIPNSESQTESTTTTVTTAKESATTSSWSQIVKEAKKEYIPQSTEEDPK